MYHSSKVGELALHDYGIHCMQHAHTRHTHAAPPVPTCAGLGDDEHVRRSTRHQLDQSIEVRLVGAVRVELLRFRFRQRALLVLQDLQSARLHLL